MRNLIAAIATASLLVASCSDDSASETSADPDGSSVDSADVRDGGTPGDTSGPGVDGGTGEPAGDTSPEADGETGSEGGIELPTGPWPNEGPDGAWCCPNGDAGDVITCPFELARSSEDAPLPSSFQIKMAWDGSRARITGFLDYWCFENGTLCQDVDALMFGIGPTGHALSASPLDMSTWDGSGALLVTLFTSPIPPLSEAYFTDDGVQGEAQIFEMIVELDAPATDDDPLCFGISELAVTDGNAAVLPGRYEGTILISFPPE